MRFARPIAALLASWSVSTVAQAQLMCTVANQIKAVSATLPAEQPVLASTLQMERGLQEHETGKGTGRPIFMSAQSAQGRTGTQASLQGDAQVRANGATIRADRLTYTQDDDELIASGNVRVARDGNVFPRAWS